MNADQIERQKKFLHNAVFTIGGDDDAKVNNINLPPYYDIILQALPACIKPDDTGYGISFNSALVDMKTGSVAEYLLNPRATQTSELNLASFSRKQYNKLVDFALMTEGRYLSFWVSNMSQAFKPLMYAEPYFPDIDDMQYLFGQAADGTWRNFFFALNWGQGEMWELAKNRLLTIYCNGYQDCYWTRITSIEPEQDPRIIRVNIAHNFPAIYFHDVDVICEQLYMHNQVDEIPFEYITSDLLDAKLSMIEDVEHSYDPWDETPPIYPLLPDDGGYDQNSMLEAKLKQLVAENAWPEEFLAEGYPKTIEGVHKYITEHDGWTLRAWWEKFGKEEGICPYADRDRCISEGFKYYV